MDKRNWFRKDSEEISSIIRKKKNYFGEKIPR